jgi:VanZ family protein
VIQGIWRWGPALLQMALIFGASSIPDLQRMPGDVSDKTMHFAAYAVLAALMLRATSHVSWQGVNGRTVVAAAGLTALYGASDELHQWFVPGRSSSMADWLADVVGASVAVSALWIVARAVSWRKRTV